jgi:hypothetical protein
VCCSAAADLAPAPGTIASASALRCPQFSRDLAIRRRSPSARRRLVQTRPTESAGSRTGRASAEPRRLSPARAPRADDASRRRAGVRQVVSAACCRASCEAPSAPPRPARIPQASAAAMRTRTARNRARGHSVRGIARAVGHVVSCSLRALSDVSGVRPWPARAAPSIERRYRSELIAPTTIVGAEFRPLVSKPTQIGFPFVVRSSALAQKGKELPARRHKRFHVRRSRAEDRFDTDQVCTALSTLEWSE